FVNRFERSGAAPDAQPEPPATLTPATTASADTRPAATEHSPGATGGPIYVKNQCMHCLDPACVSACPVAAIRKMDEGPVVYRSRKCIGCRYCMMACPFSMLAYTYDDPLTPVVRKCSMCYETVSHNGGVPACAKI